MTENVTHLTRIARIDAYGGMIVAILSLFGILVSDSVIPVVFLSVAGVLCLCMSVYGFITLLAIRNAPGDRPK